MIFFRKFPNIPQDVSKNMWNLLSIVKANLEQIMTFHEKQDSQWTVPQLINGWLHYGMGHFSASYIKAENGWVHFRGAVKSGTIPSTIFNLPFEYRPSADMYFPVVSNDVFGHVWIKPTGEVVAQSGNNTYFSLYGILFQVTL